jgi:hypothetical protein
MADPSGFGIVSGPVPGKMICIAYFGKTGPAATPFGTLGGYLCVASPVYRAGSQYAGGTKNTCTGQFSYTLQDLIDAQASVGVPGTVVHVALWFRDPPNADGFGLSNGLRFTVLP